MRGSAKMGAMRAFFILFCVIFSSLFAAEESVWIELDVEAPLLPLYLLPFDGKGSELQPGVLKELQDILAYDLKYNGMTRLLPNGKKTDEALAKSPFEGTAEVEDLKKTGAYFVVKARVKGKVLDVRLITLNPLATKAIDGIVLTGNIAKDRRQMHRVADTLHKAIFGTSGIASTHFLFTNKTYCSKTKKMVSEVYEADWDGANLRPLTYDCGYAVTPAYVPSQEGGVPGAFLYVSYATGQPKIYFSPLKSYKPTRFSLMKGNQLMPAISPSRDQIAFISDITGNPDLFVQPIHPDGSLRGKASQIFSAGKASQGTPSFSPDGKKIAFVSNKDGSPRVYMMDVPGPGASIKSLKPTLLSRHTKESTAPAWSPDGKKIAYSSRTDGVRQIWVYDLDKGVERQLTHGPGNKENPSWAPNSLHLIFNSTQNEQGELYILNLNQPEAIKMNLGAGSKRFPAWEPVK